MPSRATKPVLGRRLRTWGTFAACLACGTGLLAWLTTAMLRLELAEVEARAHAQHELAIGAALWQMDGWLLPLLATEAQRPPSDYRAFNPMQVAYTSLFNKLTPGEVMAPSPLLGVHSPYFLLHFQMDESGTLTSPQVPEGNALDVTQNQYNAAQIEEQRAVLDSLRRLLSPGSLSSFCSTGTAALPEQQIQGQQARVQTITTPDPLPEWTSNIQQRAQVAGQARNRNEYFAADGWLTGTDPGDATRGPLLPMWIGDSPHGERLAFVRRVTVGNQRLFQGLVADWDVLRTAMIGQISDPALAARAHLRRVDKPDATTQPHLLTVLPALLEVDPPEVTMPLWTPVRTLLLVAWLALLGAAGVVAFTLHAALGFGDRRARFASAVTHELRTPLTTFKMYSEMLATGMVSDPERRQQYLVTLQAESDRLARLVENVLGYARIEDGRFAARIESVPLGDLLARLRPILARRVEEAGTRLSVLCETTEARLDVDVDAVGQILFNLVDNACKYGQPPIEVRATTAGSHVCVRVCDDGPGIPVSHRERVFAAFDRGSRQPGDNEAPGIGLGLALARGLARDLGGDLRLVDTPRGACFELTLRRRVGGAPRGSA
ncbi:MAG: HAMP domain-containing sensor histidine kinase [Planctomycetota bacterium]